MRESGQRYQKSPLGRRNHARRQKRYRSGLVRKRGNRDASGFPSDRPSGICVLTMDLAPPTMAETTAPSPGRLEPPTPREDRKPPCVCSLCGAACRVREPLASGGEPGG